MILLVFNAIKQEKERKRVKIKSSGLDDLRDRGKMSLDWPWNLQVSWNAMAQSLGIFLGNLMGPYLPMRIFAYVSLAPTILFAVLFALIPDSPYHHVIAGDLVKAEASLKWFRRRDDVKRELQDLRDYANGRNVTLLQRLGEFRISGNRSLPNLHRLTFNPTSPEFQSKVFYHSNRTILFN